jgi:hypothetical protein
LDSAHLFSEYLLVPKLITAFKAALTPKWQQVSVSVDEMAALPSTNGERIETELLFEGDSEVPR